MMRLLNRLIVCAAAAMSLSAVLCYVADRWFGDSTGVVGTARWLVRETRRSQALQTRVEMVSRSTSVKRDAIAQVIAGRLRLRQAIIHFRDANELVQNNDPDLVPRFWGSTDPEELGRQVLSWTRNTVVCSLPENRQHLLSDLEREYMTLFPGAKLPQEAWPTPMATRTCGRMKANAAAR
jgi:hypothetical protein